MHAIQAIGPLDGSGAEDERAAGGAVERDAMGADARAGLGAPGDDDVLQGVIRRSRHPRQARRPEPVVQILVNLVTHDTVSQRRDLARLQSGDRGVAPEPQARELRRHLHADAAVDVRPVRHVQSAGQRVLRAARVGRRPERVMRGLTTPSSPTTRAARSALLQRRNVDARAPCMSSSRHDLPFRLAQRSAAVGV